MRSVREEDNIFYFVNIVFRGSSAKKSSKRQLLEV